MDAAPGTTIALSLRLSKAMVLARSGKLREAQGLVAGDRTIPDHPLELQALAALVTAEGDNLRALKLWELLLQREPQHAEARRMIDAIELWISRPAWMRYWPLAASTVLAIVVAGIFWILASASPEPLRPTQGPLNEETPVAAPEATRPEPIRSAPAPAIENRPAPIQTPPPTVTFPGISSGSGSQRKKAGNR